MRAYRERWPLGYSSAAWYGWRERPRGKSGAGEVEEVKIITKFWVNGESETAQAVSALPSPFGQRIARRNVVDRSELSSHPMYVLNE